jgi:hypothetical protein
VRKFIAAVAVVGVSCGAWAAARSIRGVDFYDNPAILMEVRESGLVVLDTQQGTLAAPLAEVDGKMRSEAWAKAQEFIHEAQRDMVAWARLRNGKIRVWYGSEDGAVCLNEKLRALMGSR